MDFGCGAGDLIDKLKALGCTHVEGLEVDSIFARQDINIDSDTIAWLEDRPGKFDVIVTREAMYYINKNEQDRLWLAFYKALAPGGKIFVKTYNGALACSQWIFQKDLDVKLIPNEILLRNLAVSAGFEGINLYGISPSSRTFIGIIVSTVFSIFRVASYNLKYISERGLDSQNPTLFTKQILLRASKSKNSERDCSNRIGQG